MKACFRCHSEKPLSEFYPHPRMADGHLNKCRACTKADTAARRAAKPEAVKAGIQAWRSANAERMRAGMRDHYRRNKPSYLVRNLNREQRAVGVMSNDIVARLTDLQKGRCACCGRDLKETGHHVDHVLPLALGGSNTDDNAQLLCPTCNLSKGPKHPVVFMQSRGFLL